MVQLEGSIRRILQQTKEVREASVIEAKIVGRHIEVKVALLPEGLEVWTTLAGGMRGLYRVPTEGDLAIVGLVDGAPSEGYILAFFSADERSSVPDDVEAGSIYIVPPAGEGIVARTRDGGGVELETDGARVEIGAGGGVTVETGSATIELTSAGAISVKNGAGGYFEIDAAGFVDVGNSVGSVVKLIADLALAVQTSVVPTVIGPQVPINPQFAILSATANLIRGA